MPTAPTGLRERKKAHTRNRLLAETRDLLEAMPPTAFTVPEICEAAFVGSRSFHRYFETKTDALLEVCRISPFRLDGSDHDDTPREHPDYVLAAKCFTYLGAPWLGAMISRLCDGDLTHVEAAARAARQIIETGRTMARAQAEGGRS